MLWSVYTNGSVGLRICLRLGQGSNIMLIVMDCLIKRMEPESILSVKMVHYHKHCMINFDGDEHGTCKRVFRQYCTCRLSG